MNITSLVTTGNKAPVGKIEALRLSSDLINLVYRLQVNDQANQEQVITLVDASSVLFNMYVYNFNAPANQDK